jgi:hypothetical protein
MVGISEATYHCWKSTKSEFSECIKKAQDKFDDLILSEATKSLVKLIRGYTEQEKKTVTVDTGKRGEDNKPIVRVKEHIVTDKHFQPVTAAVIFALKNRQPEKWRDRKEVDANVKFEDGLEHMTDEQLKVLIDAEKKS